MARYVAKRLGLAVITLVLLSMIVFAAAQLLPGDLGRSVLGRDASADAVAAYNREHGTDLDEDLKRPAEAALKLQQFGDN